jgi:hypothetical protein
VIIECSFCQKKLNIPPNAKLPLGKPFSFTCPSCGQKNTVTLEAPPDAPASPDFTAIPPAAPPPRAPVPPSPARPDGTAFREAGPPIPPPQAGPGYSVNEVRSIMELDDIGSEGLKSALVAYDSEEAQTLLEQKLTAMGYKVSLALNVRDAAKQLKFGRFQVVLIQEDYYGATIKSNQLLKAVNSLELAIRRKMFIGLIGPSFTSLDDLRAFSLSLDTVINSNDIEDIERLLISGLGHVSKFFATYNELRSQRGEE